MTLYIYNTLSRKKEKFEPVKSGRVSMYVCGPTVYDSCHIGHARSLIAFDVIARYFKATGYEITYVRNFTDIDDKIINKANQLGTDTVKVSDKYIKEFYTDMNALNVERATFEPKATDNIDQIITVIEQLIQKNMAYHKNGDVFFDVISFKEYGKLSGRKIEDMIAGARVDVNEKKRNPFDFVLWKKAKPGEPHWESPWGNGRPGWHIECSAMSYKYLGELFDIHGGGKDLIFPHHENEIAQSEGLLGKPFVKYWIHNGFVNIDNEKMSKSLGNFLMIKDVIKACHSEAVRLFLLSNHYRSPIDYSDKAMKEANAGLDKLYALLLRVKENTDEASAMQGNMDSNTKELTDGMYWKLFCEAMDDDFNTARGIGVLYDAVRNVNRMLDKAKESSMPWEKHEKMISHKKDIIKIGNTLGILFDLPEKYFSEKKIKDIEKQSIDPAFIDKMVQNRNKARKEKNWEKADNIRMQLEKMNVVVEDKPEGSVWKIKK